MEKEGYEFDPVDITVNGTVIVFPRLIPVIKAETATIIPGGGNTVSGKVVDSDGNGIPNVVIMMNYVDSEELPLSTATDANGNYAFEDVANNTYMVLAMSDSYTVENGPFFITVDNANVTVDNFVIAYQEGMDGVTVRGQFVDTDGNGLAEINVEILISGGDVDSFYGDTYTGSDGSWAIPYVPQGEFTLQWHKSGCPHIFTEITVGNSPITIDPITYDCTGTSREFDGYIDADGTVHEGGQNGDNDEVKYFKVSGYVKDSDDNAMVAVIVSLIDKSTGKIALDITNLPFDMTATDFDGYYLFEKCTSGRIHRCI